MKKVLSVVLAVLMLAAIAAVPVFADDAIAVTTADEFLAMESGKSYYLANDIDFGGKVFDTYLIKGENYVVDLDGNGHTLKNFSFKSDNASGDLAVFQQFASGTIKNINFGSKDAHISYVLNDPNDNKSFAFLVASTKGEETPRIENVHIFADMEINYTANLDARLSCGGFIAYARNYTIVKSSMNGKIAIKNNGADCTKWRNAGGFIGSDKYDKTLKFVGTIEDCVNNANVSLIGCAKEGRVAGFVAYSDKETNNIKNCINNGAITLETSAGTGHIAGIFACAKPGKDAVIDGCRNNGKIVYNCKNAEDAKTGTIAGGIIGFAQRGAITVKNCINAVEIKTGAAYNGEIVAFTAESGVTVEQSGNKTSSEIGGSEITPDPKPDPNPSTGDHSLVIIALAAVLSISGALCAVVVRCGKENN